MSQTSSIINDSFYYMANNNKRSKSTKVTGQLQDEVIQRVLPLIPRVLYFLFFIRFK